MSAKTKIVVLHMKELIYTAIFVGLGILLVVLLLFMFLPKKENDKSVETMKYVAGVYTSSILFHDSTLDVQVFVVVFLFFLFFFVFLLVFLCFFLMSQ